MESRHHFHEELRQLYESLVRMSVQVEEQIRKSMTALDQRDPDLAQQVIAGDEAVDVLLLELEDRATTLIARQQPVAGELREIITVGKIAGHLERIGDHARHFARAVDRTPRQALEVALPLMRQMAETGVSMIRDGITAFIDHDAARACKVAERDDEIDATHKELYTRLVDLIKAMPDDIDAIINLMFLNRFLERLGDHVTNICEWVVFAETGTHPTLNK